VGVCSRKEKTGGRGVATILEGTPPARNFWGGWGSWDGSFMRIAGSGPEVFKKSSVAGLWFFENPEQRDYAF